MRLSYDVIVIGAGHAGCEAAAAAARMGAKTCLVTMDMNKIAQMSCNPAVGGIAKGQIVREIDALGGETARVADATTIQFRMLNRSKGPAMWSPRAQCDRGRYIWQWRKALDNIAGLDLWQDQAEELLVEDGKAAGVRTVWGVTLRAKSVVITAGTFLNGLLHIGRRQLAGGRIAEPAVRGLTESITRHGIRSGRMKTGTPVRMDKRSIDFSLLERQDGDTAAGAFSYMTPRRRLPQLPCWICNTNEEVHKTLRGGLADSPLYNGQIKSTGPRYCPSIETKLVTFPERNHHPLFIEPEGVETNEMYLNGFSSSMPIDIQIEALRKIPALRDIKVYRPGYAIEYDYFDPTQLRHTMESKIVRGLFLAGQVNGTTGYEEAAGQGLVAGVNAALLGGMDGYEGRWFTMQRDESYIGVLIDDLTMKGVDEPYRMFTSRAEYRILLRQDNADERLTERSYKMGLATRERHDRWTAKKEAIEALLHFCEEETVKPREVNGALERMGTTPLQFSCKVSDILARPQADMRRLAEALPRLKSAIEAPKDSKEEIVEEVETKIKYKGYIEREKMVAEKMRRLEDIRIRGRFSYRDMRQLSTEARQKLEAIDPETIAEASRIPGVSPSDINAMLVLLGR